MSLFKNLYLDLSYLNPFKKKKESYSLKAARPGMEINKESVISNVPLSSPRLTELPQISKRLLGEQEIKTNNILPDTVKKLPSISKPKVAEPPVIDSGARPPEQKLKREEKTADINEDGTFFKSLYTNLSAEENYHHGKISKHVLSRNLFDQMQEFWQDKKEGLDKNEFNSAVKDNLMKKMNELQELEVEWQRLQLQHEKLNDELASKEMIIENNLLNLKKSFKRLHLNSDVKDEHHFVLSNGMRLKSLKELFDLLKEMDDNVFSYHVNEYKNDFSSWIKDVMALPDLAADIKSTRTKEDMHKAIDAWTNSA